MQNFEILARALIIENGRILVVKRTGANYFFIPGGHVEFGEEAEQALVRELKEEIGIMPTSLYLIGMNENIYEQSGHKHQEYNLLFKTELESYDITSLEAHLTFDWIPVNELNEAKILPEPLKKAAIKWLNDKQMFWSTPKYY